MALSAEVLDRIPERRIHYPNTESGRAARREATLVADAIVVGTGAGGSVAAAILAERGLDVLMLEEGPLEPTENFTTHVLDMVRRLYRDAGTSMILGNPGIVFAEGRCVGGSTTINGGMTWKAPERVLEEWEEKYELPDVGPRAMEPFFEETGRELHPERQQPDTLGRHDHLFVQGAEKLGWNAKPATRNMRRCVGLNNCAFGCPTGAKQSALVTWVPRALRAGARMMTDTKVEHVLFDGRRATGVRGSFLGSNRRPTYRFTAHAPMVVVACGARHTVGVLKRSRVRLPRLGRNLTTHPNAKVVGIFDERLEAWWGTHQAHQIHDFLEERILIGYAMIPPGLFASGVPGVGEEHAERMTLYNHAFPAACLIEDTGTGRVVLGPDREPYMLYSLNRRDTETCHRGVAKAAELMFAAGARRVLLPFAGLGEIDSADDVRKILDRPLDASGIELMTVHIMGSAGMGTDRSRGATDPWGRVFDVEGLYVADASLFPGPVGVNPQWTVMALAARNAHRWAEHDVQKFRVRQRGRTSGGRS